MYLIKGHLPRLLWSLDPLNCGIHQKTETILALWKKLATTCKFVAGKLESVEPVSLGWASQARISQCCCDVNTEDRIDAVKLKVVTPLNKFTTKPAFVLQSRSGSVIPLMETGSSLSIDFYQHWCQIELPDTNTNSQYPILLTNSSDSMAMALSTESKGPNRGDHRRQSGGGGKETIYDSTLYSITIFWPGMINRTSFMEPPPCPRPDSQGLWTIIRS